MRPHDSLRGLFAAIAILCFASAEARAMDLVMFESPSCGTCKLFKREVLPIWESTPAGKAITLWRVQMGEKVAFRLRSPVTFTPTFVWVENGAEVGRFSGYYGKDQFFGIVNQAARAFHRGNDGPRRKMSALP